MSRLLSAVLLSAALIWLHSSTSPANLNNSIVPKAATSQADEILPKPQQPSPQTVNRTVELSGVEPEKQQEEPKPVVEQVTQTGCEQYRDLISKYSWNVDVAIAVCNAESSGNRFNENWSDYHSFADCSGSFGLFQINCSHGQVFDAAENIRIAASMYEARGWQPWSATTCKYKVKCY